MISANTQQKKTHKQRELVGTFSEIKSCINRSVKNGVEFNISESGICYHEDGFVRVLQHLIHTHTDTDTHTDNNPYTSTYTIPHPPTML